MDVLERRKDRRLPLKLNVLCTQAGGGKPRLYSGTVVNISSGGLYFEIEEGGFGRGNVVDVSIEVPAGAGRLEFGGTMRTTASVVRTEAPSKSRVATRELPVYGVALQFCSRVRLSQ